MTTPKQKAEKLIELASKATSGPWIAEQAFKNDGSLDQQGIEEVILMKNIFSQ